MQVTIWDPVAPHKYHKGSLSERPLGGTEASVIRLANALDELGHETRIVFEKPSFENPTIILRDPGCLEGAKGSVALWMHDYLQAGDISPRHIDLIQKKKPHVVAVSDWHKANCEEHLGCEVTRIYNPVPAPERRPKIPNKYIYLGSPHKGLERTLNVFAEYRKLEPEAHLYILNPGYCKSPDIQTKSVKTLGPLKHAEAMRHLAESQALLHFNDRCPETFGIVYAEAKMAGTRIVTFDHGAAEEVTKGISIRMPLDASNETCATAIALDQKETCTHQDPRFEPLTIAREWETLFRLPRRD